MSFRTAYPTREEFENIRIDAMRMRSQAIRAMIGNLFRAVTGLFANRSGSAKTATTA